MPASWGCRTHDRDALIPIGDQRIFQGMIVLFTTVIVFLWAGVMGSVKGSLGGIDNYFLFIFSRLIITADRFEVGVTSRARG